MTRSTTRTLIAHASRRDDHGMTTAEYAVGTVSACGFAGILYQLLTSSWAADFLQGLFNKVTTLLPF